MIKFSSAIMLSKRKGHECNSRFLINLEMKNNVRDLEKLVFTLLYTKQVQNGEYVEYFKVRSTTYSWINFHKIYEYKQFINNQSRNNYYKKRILKEDLQFYKKIIFNIIIKPRSLKI